MRGLRGASVDGVIAADVVIVGAGVAGLSVALELAGLRVHLISKGRLESSGASAMAQGGVAAAVGTGDSPEMHRRDTVQAAAGLADPGAARLLTEAGPARIARLLALGARFDRKSDGQLDLGREAAHGRARILHAGGDATGAELVRVLSGAARAVGAHLFERVTALDLALRRGRVGGVLARHPDGSTLLHLAGAVVLATGGIGRAYSHTTNPAEATGDGLAMAARAGATLADLEFVQFHPTALAVGADPMPLITEALRGAGAVLLDGRGERFMVPLHEAAELAPRDVVARAIWRLRRAGEEVFLDATAAVGEDFPARFPSVYRHCRGQGLDPRREPIPVAPAAHYHMGGIAVDTRGRSSLPGLWACGEAACTGVHGANRLASNSLLEGMVFGTRLAADLRAALRTGAAAGPLPLELPPSAVAEVADRERQAAIRQTLWEGVGLERDRAGLTAARRHLERLAGAPAADDPETRNLLLVARMVTEAALARTESRGSHYRSDYPATDPSWRRRLQVTLPFGPGARPGVQRAGLEAVPARRAGAGS